VTQRIVRIPYERTFPVPVAQAYAWLTDYQDDDPQRTTAVIKSRPVLERHEDRVVLDGTLEILGRRGRGKAEVRLFPPDHWTASILEGSGRGSVYDYRLTPVPEGCRLHVDYRISTRRLRSYLRVLLARRLVWKELDTMWDGFARSMQRDLRS
jgi:hypothetical protein